MVQNHHYAIIMAGGVGSRFWPLSREEHPKQFIDLLGSGESLFQKTFKRIRKILPPENIYIVTNQRYREYIKEQACGIDDEQILLEPYPRNTAPCIAYGAYKIYEKDPNAVVIVSPSDHVIKKTELFQDAIQKAFNFARENKYLITVGIKPDKANTGYGYIQLDEEDRKEEFYKVKTFTGEPNKELAEYFIRTGEFLWNSGIFVWSVDTMIEAYQYFLPEIHETFISRRQYFYTAKETEKMAEAYELCGSISIDAGLMENADNVMVIPAEFHWSDLGSWKSLFEFLQKDSDNNALKTSNHLVRSSENSLVSTSNKKLVVLNNTSNLIVVETPDILMVADLDKEQEIRQIVNEVKINWGDEFA